MLIIIDALLEGEIIMISIFFMIIVIFGLVSIDQSLRKKLKNDERIINRLDLLWSEINKSNERK
ncbi:hypothetical protein PSAB_19470 [Paenibacillus sabinae T27]|uniref:Uncharacterized protein n=1 Tax=Paenibacillus sabinae T27 TaxID=1268072 RepID=X4ZNM4_9BACL|nr:hypothetical protein PSAB_19470 [Paenibacillus sabinae T27]